MNDNAPSSQTCPKHGLVLVRWFLAGKGRPATLVCETCEEDRRRRLGWLPK